MFSICHHSNLKKTFDPEVVSLVVNQGANYRMKNLLFFCTTRAGNFRMVEMGINA